MYELESTLSGHFYLLATLWSLTQVVLLAVIAVGGFRLDVLSDH